MVSTHFCRRKDTCAYVLMNPNAHKIIKLLSVVVFEEGSIVEQKGKRGSLRIAQLSMLRFNLCNYSALLYFLCGFLKGETKKNAKT